MPFGIRPGGQYPGWETAGIDGPQVVDRLGLAASNEASAPSPAPGGPWGQLGPWDSRGQRPYNQIGEGVPWKGTTEIVRHAAVQRASWAYPVAAGPNPSREA